MQFSDRLNTLPNAIIQNDTNSWSDLHEAAATGDEKNLLAILSARNKFYIYTINKIGNTALHEAALRGFSRCVKILCSHSPKQGKKDEKNARYEIQGAKEIFQIQNNAGFSPLHLAAQNGHNQCCRELLFAGADPDIQNNYGDTALHTACRYGHAGATRILLSAFCDPNKVNLNGDTALHISCAMGKRKLTRILLEAEIDTNLRNAQGETPKDIARRKHFTEIVSILTGPRKIRNSKSKQREKEKTADLPADIDQNGSLNKINWSPYGCHYFPDPCTFPPAKIETLPKEPLKEGEQYFLDLSGRIRKGPIGVGSTCYCSSFFQSFEKKLLINQELARKSRKTKGKSDVRLKLMAHRSNDQIKRLTRSMVVDKIRCKNKRMHIDNWLKQERKLVKPETQISGQLSRCKSLDFQDDSGIWAGGKVKNAKSCSLLDERSLVDSYAKENNEADNRHYMMSLTTTTNSDHTMPSYNNDEAHFCGAVQQNSHLPDINDSDELNFELCKTRELDINISGNSNIEKSSAPASYFQSKNNNNPVRNLDETYKTSPVDYHFKHSPVSSEKVLGISQKKSKDPCSLVAAQININEPGLLRNHILAPDLEEASAVQSQDLQSVSPKSIITNYNVAAKREFFQKLQSSETFCRPKAAETTTALTQIEQNNVYPEKFEIRNSTIKTLRRHDVAEPANVSDVRTLFKKLSVNHCI